jgi:hypothetical protein
LLEPGLHKTGKDASLQDSTGMYRHKSYNLCGHFALAITTLIRLHDERLDWHFFRANNPTNPKAPAPWQEKTIIDGWESERAPYTAFKRMLEALDLRWSKVTHLRTLSIEYASQHGLNRAEIASMSKHTISSLDDCYITQLLPVALQVMAGFERDAVYNVRRMTVSLPDGWGVEHITNCFCPQIHEWRNQQSSALGDNEMDAVPGGESAAHNFLWGVIPMFCMVVFQDGIYWIEDMPTHPISMFIKGQLPDWYPQWAQQERDRIRQLQYNERGHLINQLEPPSKAAFDLVHEQMHARFQKLD